MDDTAKYLIHASITADGVVERSDVVGAIFGQTEGLLGDDLDLRDLQQSSKVGRIDVEVSSEAGQSDGEITIATSLDKVETAILAASLETITRVGPCRARVEVADIEDVREAKRREVVERAKELLSESFDDSIMTSAEILEEVRESIRVEDITEFEGLPAGPRVADSDAIVVVEGRADVLTLLRYGIKNAVAVEGTNVPDPVAELTQERTVTAFLDGDRGGELILRELAQVGDVDYVAFAPANRSVEELGRREVMRALREKVPYDTLPHEGSARAAVHASTGTAEGPTDPPQESQGTTESAATPASEADDASDTGDSEDNQADDGLVPADATAGAETDGAGAAVESASAGVDAAPSEDGDQTTESQEAVTADEWADGDTTAVSDAGDDGVTETETDDEQSTQAQTDAATDEEIAAERASTPDGDDASTLRDHVRAVIEGETGTARLLDDEFDVVEAVDAEDVFEAIRTADAAPYAVVLDDVLSQRVLDVAAQRGVEHVVVRETDEFVKQPVDVRVRTVSELVVE